MKSLRMNMLEGSVARPILLFFLPIILGSFFQQLYNTVDAIVVGNFVGKEALAAVGGSTGILINLLVGFVVGVSSGATVVIAQYFGSREDEGVHKGVDASMFIAVALGLFLMIVGIVLAPWMLELLNVPEDIFDYSLTYFQIYMIGMIPSLIYNNGAGILRAVGDSKRPLYFLIAACMTNIVLDLLFVVVFHLAVVGVAVATVLSQVVSCVLTMRVLSASEESYAFHLKSCKVDWSIVSRIVVIGLPVGIQSCLYSVANLFVQASINGYGTDTVAAYTAFGKIDAIFWNTSAALGQSVLTFCGQNFGAGKIDRVKKGIRTSTLIYIIGAGAISLFCFVGGEFIYRLFTPEEEVIQIGLSMLRYLCPLWITFAGVEILSSGIRACGDSIIPMIMTAVGIGAFRIIWIIFYPGTTIFDTLICYPISWVATSLLFLVYYLQGGWLKRSMKQREKLSQAL